MASSTSAISMTVPPQLTQNFKQPISSPFLNPLPLRISSPNSKRVATTVARLEVKAASSSLKEKVVTGLTAAALTASMVVPDAAEAAVSPSLKNFLLSIVAGGVVLGVIVGAVIGVANFDPVKRS